MNLTYWLREVGGWLLIFLGLIVFYQAYDLLLAKRVFEAAPLTFVGFVVFRGGIHLLKVAVAARAAQALPESAAPPVRRPRPAGRPLGPTPKAAVVPGPRSRR